MAAGSAGETQQERVQSCGALQRGRAVGRLAFPLPRKVTSPAGNARAAPRQGSAAFVPSTSELLEARAGSQGRELPAGCTGGRERAGFGILW